MAKLSLRLAFFAIGLSFVAPKVADSFGVSISQNPLLILCLPAVVFGSASFFATRSFARSWPVMLCVAIAWAGLFYGAGRINHRGHINVAFLTVVLPIGALIVEQRCWWLCARMYVLGTASALGIAIWFEYVINNAGLIGAFYRFGSLWNTAGTLRLANPNILGDHLALGAVLAFMLYLRDGRLNSRRQTPTEQPSRWSLACVIFLSLGCLLTASRGACVALFGGMSVLLLWGAKQQDGQRLKELVALGGILLSAMLFITTASEFKPWHTLQTRMEDRTNILSASGRVPVWTAATKIWLSSPQCTLVGLGAGMVPETLGVYFERYLPDGVSTSALDSHNSFVEWGLSFGLIGMIAGACLLWNVCCKARQLDLRDGSVNRLAVLLCFGLASMTYVTVFQMLFVAAGPLILAMLSEPEAVGCVPAPTLRSAPARSAGAFINPQSPIPNPQSLIPNP